MKYIIRKVVEAKSLVQAMEKERSIKPLEVYLSNEEFSRVAFTDVTKKEVGFNKKK